MNNAKYVKIKKNQLYLFRSQLSLFFYKNHFNRKYTKNKFQDIKQIDNFKF